MRRYRLGFTLIELLVVVAIIALLLAILVPAVSRARDQAKRTRSAAQLQGISVSIESFATDMGAYPPSDPFVETDSRLDSEYAPSGAHLLAWALIGDPNGVTPFCKKPYLSADGANAISDDIEHDGVAAFPRGDPELINGHTVGGEGCYVMRDVSFGSPILYYRANRRARYSTVIDPRVYQCVAQGRTDSIAAAYYVEDNGFVTGSQSQYDVGFYSGPFDGWRPTSDYSLDRVEGFADYVEVEDTRFEGDLSLARAQNADGFLLISAGSDGIFGPTKPGPGGCDDIGNFKVPTVGPPPP